MLSSLTRSLWLLLALLLCSPADSQDGKHDETSPAAQGTESPQFNNDQTRTTLDQSAIGYLIKANGLKVPSSELEWSRAIGQHATVQSAWIPFSASPAKTSLLEPRLVLAAQGSPKKMNGLNLDGNLFIAIIPRKDGTKDLEFISRNRETNEFDFGIIRNFGSPAKMVLELADKTKCMICHRTGGPFFSVTPWSQTLTNPAMLRAFAERLGEDDPKQFGAFHQEVERLADDAKKAATKPEDQKNHFERALEDSKIVRKATLHGITIFPARFEPVSPANSVSELDATVSLANRSLRVTAFLKSIPKPEIRERAYALAAEAAARSTLGDEEGAKQAVGKLRGLLAQNPFPINKLAIIQPFRMDDFNPAFPGGVRRFGKEIGDVEEFAGEPFKLETMKAIKSHNALREAGNLTLPKKLLASDTTSLDEKPLIYEEAVLALGLGPIEHAVGMHETDSAAFALLFNQMSVYPGFNKKQIVDRFVSSDAFKKASQSPGFPQRERLLAVLHEGLETQAREIGVKSLRTQGKDFVPSVYSTSFAPNNGPKTSPKVAGPSSDKCVGCHTEIRKPLRFAPDDRDAWKRWLTSQDPMEQARAKAWLKKVQRTLEEKTMPPPGSAEVEGYEPKRKELLLLLKELSDKPLTGMPK